MKIMSCDWQWRWWR